MVKSIDKALWVAWPNLLIWLYQSSTDVQRLLHIYLFTQKGLEIFMVTHYKCQMKETTYLSALGVNKWLMSISIGS